MRHHLAPEIPPPDIVRGPSCGARLRLVSLDVGNDLTSDFRGAVAPILEAAVKPAVLHSPACDGSRGKLSLGGMGLNGLDECALVHVRIKDFCPLYVKGLLSPFCSATFGVFR